MILLGDNYILQQLGVDKTVGVAPAEILGRRNLFGENIRREMKHRCFFKNFLFEIIEIKCNSLFSFS